MNEKDYCAQEKERIEKRTDTGSKLRMPKVERRGSCEHDRRTANKDS
jgi:hypothetical protein